jgi:hypothetical protein
VLGCLNQLHWMCSGSGNIRSRLAFQGLRLWGGLALRGIRGPSFASMLDFNRQLVRHITHHQFLGQEADCKREIKPVSLRAQFANSSEWASC